MPNWCIGHTIDLLEIDVDFCAQRMLSICVLCVVDVMDKSVGCSHARIHIWQSIMIGSPPVMVEWQSTLFHPHFGLSWVKSLHTDGIPLLLPIVVERIVVFKSVCTN